EDEVCKPSVLQSVQECLNAVAIEGTTRRVFKETPFAVAGKTGTSHFASGNIKYSDGIYLASYVGYFPVNEPKYSCIVVIKTRPRAAMHYGGQLAAPVFKEVATKLYAMYVEDKDPVKNKFISDSTDFFYAGYTSDVKD